VLGYVDEDGKGHVGMEARAQRPADGSGARGQPVALSIDARVQGALEDELKRGMRSVNAAARPGSCSTSTPAKSWRSPRCPEFDPNKIDAEGERLSVQPRHQPGLRARLDVQAADRGARRWMPDA
jgi:cell division protein FtsI (penicillin-binding protein 3)